jgi:hypothetical protein
MPQSYFPSDPPTVADDIYMMGHPEHWPQWPRLPVKHRRERDASGFPKLGIMVEPRSQQHEPEPLVYLTNLFFGTLEGAEFLRYESLEQLAQDWMVD